MHKLFKIQRIIIELIFIIFILYLTANLLIPIGKNFGKSQPNSLVINLDIRQNKGDSLDATEKTIENKIRELEYKYYDSIANNISNVITVIGIFFTVYVLVISIFQYLKSKSYEDKLELLESKLIDKEKEFEIMIKKYSDDIGKKLIISNLYSRAQHYFIVSDYANSGKVLATLLEHYDDKNYISSFDDFDIYQIKKMAIITNCENKNYKEAVKIYETILDRTKVGLLSSDFPDYLDYLKIKEKHLNNKKNIDEYIAFVEYLKSVIEVLDEDDNDDEQFLLDSFEFTSSLKDMILNTYFKMAEIYENKNDKIKQVFYLEEGLSLLELFPDKTEFLKYIRKLLDYYIYSYRNNKSFEFEKFNLVYDHIVEKYGSECYISNYYYDNNPAYLAEDKELIRYIAEYYMNKYQNEYRKEMRDHILRKLFVFYSSNINNFNDVILESKLDYVFDMLRLAIELYNHDVIFERGTGIDPFKDREIIEDTL